MKAILVDARQGLLDERRRQGIDKLDERWDGMWHLVTPPKRWHGRLNTDVLLTLGSIAKQQGLDAYGDGTGVFAAADDWRVPDQVYARPEHRTDDGVSSADIVIEVRSPDDETYEKLRSMRRVASAKYWSCIKIAESSSTGSERMARTYRSRTPPDGCIAQPWR